LKKRALLFIALSGALLLAGCGSNDTTSQTTYNNGTGNLPFKPTTHLLHRSLVTNYYAGQLQVMDTVYDKLTTFTFPTGAQPTYMQPSPDGTLTLVNNSGSGSLSSLNNNQESVKAAANLGGYTESFVTSVNNKFGFAAVPSYSNGIVRTSGAIVRFNPTDGSLNTQIPFPAVQYLGMDAAEKHLLAFTQSDDSANWVDLTTTDPNTQVPPYYPLTLSDANGAYSLSRPIAVFFSSDNSKAYVLSCGVECGGSTYTVTTSALTACPTGNPAALSLTCEYPAYVTEIDTTSIVAPASPVTGTGVTAKVLKTWPLLGARHGLIDLTANKLYVAGSSTTSVSNDCPFAEVGTPACAANSGGNNVQDGYFTVIDLAAGTAGQAIRIGNGVKRWIRNIKGVYWVASLNCGVQSCITMVNPTGGTASVLATARGDATGISLAVNSGEVYTIEGGVLYIYDQKANPITSQYNTDVKGQASDVLYIN
jgi:hypothetical protein